MPAECFDRERNECRITRACRLRGVLAEAAEAFHATLDRYTVADLVPNGKALVRLLGIAS